MCGSDQSITFKPYGIPIQTLAVKPNRNWTNLIPAQIESNEGKIISVCFDVSEFRKGQVEFENENTGGGHIELCNSVRENVRSWMSHLEVQHVGWVSSNMEMNP
jgi:hypothetical protein